MPNAADHGPEWLFDEWVSRFGAGYEAMAAEPLPFQPVPPPGTAPADPLIWRQPFDLAPDAWVEIAVPAEAWRLLGSKVLAAAGIDEATDDDSKPTYMELLQQSLSGLASAMSGVAGKEVGCGKGAEANTAAAAAPGMSAVEWNVGGKTVIATFLASSALLAGLRPAPPPPPPPAAPKETRAAAAGAASSQAAAVPTALELIYDVELPVSVSFGRAHLPVKEVLKLTSGSIVELNRAIAEPVEIIVNNCVIARGEVVVVEGNYGVRILEIVSRSERLRTLH